MPDPTPTDTPAASLRRGSRRAATAVAAFLLAAASVAAYAQIAAAQGRPSAASVVASSGDTRLMRPSALLTPLRPGEQIRAGDRVLTGDDGRVELRFVDGAVVAVQPGSDFKVDEFRYDRDGERSFLSLARGAIRTVTGAIGKRVHEDFRLKTPTATIGIRGTDFETIETFCGPAGCAAGQRAGLTVTVYKGRVAVSNDAGTTEVPEGATLRVRTRSEPATFGDVAPAEPKAVPEVVPKSAPPAGRGRGSGGGESGDGDGPRNDRGNGNGSSGAGGGPGKGGPQAFGARLLLQHVPVRY